MLARYLSGVRSAHRLVRITYDTHGPASPLTCPHIWEDFPRVAGFLRSAP